MNGMGDIRVDVHTLQRTLGPQVDSLAPGDLVRAAAAVADADIQALIAGEDERFEIDPALSAAEREDHARMQLGLEQLLAAGGYGAYSTHFDAIAEDGRFTRLPLAAASSLMAAGYGYGAEGDALTAALMCAARDLLGETQFTEMYAMDFPTDSILMSHMGEGNWALARADRPVRADQAPARDRRPRGPADVPVPVRDRPRDARDADLLGWRPLPAARLRGRDPGHGRAAGSGDAVRLLPPGQWRCARAWTRGCVPGGRTIRC